MPESETGTPARKRGTQSKTNQNRVSIAVVKQRLRLGSASPVLHKAFLEEKISLRDLMAFCVTDNHQRQEQVWKQIKTHAYINTHTIKQMLTENTVPASDKPTKQHLRPLRQPPPCWQSGQSKPSPRSCPTCR